MHPKDEDGEADSVDPDQTSPQEQSDLGLSAQSVQTCLSENRIIMVSKTTDILK